MRLLVTGATGFIGSWVARRLLQDGHTVRVLVRPGHDLDRLRAAGFEVSPGDLLDRDSLSRATEGVIGVFHVAALYSFSARDKKQIYRVNVDGTVVLLDAARRAGVSRFVYTSSAGVLPASRPDRLPDESFAATTSQLPDDYHRSKLLGERAALEASRPGFEVVGVNPTAPVGPGDVKPTPTGRIVLEFLGRRTPGYLDTALNLIDVRDVAAGHALAFERGRPGERYILGNLNTTLVGVYRMLQDATGLSRRPVRVPFRLVLAAAFADEFLEERLMRRPSYLPVGGVRASAHRMHVNSSKAVRELGLPQSPVSQALADAAAWFVARGYVRRVTRVTAA
ncbi:MAG: NAD-dependent epimerase/dehydratase family protein [Chloroflexi bacterium]|nr:NAD-dependent epimerase/dehydratase family protein [Chloroflexota bacterium]